jgi:hypothetical protein
VSSRLCLLHDIFLVLVVCELLEVSLLLLGASQPLVDWRIHRLFGKEHFIEVARVIFVLHVRNEWGHHLLIGKLVPVYIYEEGMLLDIVSSSV